jgi:hypothetical protein
LPQPPADPLKEHVSCHRAAGSRSDGIPSASAIWRSAVWMVRTF